MTILSAQQIRELDLFTIENEPISSIELMERAATSCVDYLLKNEKPIAGKSIKVFAGQGNNGGDGLAIARQLAEKGYEVYVYCVQTTNKPTDDFLQNLKRLQNQEKVSITNIAHSNSFPNIYESDAVIDTLFGSGLTRKVEGLMAELITFINKHSEMTIAIDIPSGMFCDKTSEENENANIKAHLTLSFLPVKRAFLFQENKSHYGEIVYLDIGLLLEDYLKQKID
ncbi:MAG: NAD(P)H-hydrate epimerase [Bacteroidales bacterium]|jgi:NAD(P)H-hydrate epimerase|nr:NAD(P)H-hydrate epimerase [Bacteroidales bacterium]